MSQEQFIRLLQSLITMTDPDNCLSIAYSKTILENLLSLAMDSRKCHPITLRSMKRSITLFERLMAHKEDFAGVPGDYAKNKAMRDRLAAIVQPGC